MEVEDRDTKRLRVTPNTQQLGMANNAYSVLPQQHYPLDEPSPLGLKLKISTSLLEMIQMHLAQFHGKKMEPAKSGETIRCDHNESSSLISEQLKVSNIPGFLLKIGNWEYQSRCEGNLVAKFFFAKHKLVWEILESGLKSKIEIEWSNITALQADCPEIGESSLAVVISGEVHFFRETNPQPRKHTIWQPCSDFTNGEASSKRLHIIKFPQGTLQNHFEKLIQSDSRLNFLSRQPDLVVDSINAGESALTPGFPDAIMPPIPTATQPTYFTIEQQGHGGKMLEHSHRESFSPNSVDHIDGHMNQIDESQVAGKRSTDQFKEGAGLCHSLSKLDVVNCSGNIIVPVADPSPAQPLNHKAHLEHLKEMLLNDCDSHLPHPTDEKSLMSRVNSLSCLLEKDGMEGSNSLVENQRCDTSLNPTPTQMGTNHGPHGVFDSRCTSEGKEPEETC